PSSRRPRRRHAAPPRPSPRRRLRLAQSCRRDVAGVRIRPVKALFFLLDGESNGSSALRVMQYLPYLRAAGIEPRVSRPVPEALYQRWMERGRNKAGFYGLFLATRVLDVLRANRADVAVIQRDLFP